ncbi:MerR family transcriptional regulator [Bradyrhizobium mercantei]|uniref:MerR family transcriptional regulator n=1 Tax=Bradyrhizobium mercantei TaxID=1904807 RepID=UPI00097880B8|nr:MerR family transcriptional regulator [Bradyrhizobium mercantei]
MNIGELATRSGLSHSRIRFYERVGLLKTVDRQPNGYRSYPPEAVVMLALIATAQQAGFSLDEIRALVPPDLVTWEHDALLESLHGKVKEIEALQARLAQSKAGLVELIKDIETKPDGVDCEDNARRLLSRLPSGELTSATTAAADVKMLGKKRRPARRG